MCIQVAASMHDAHMHACAWSCAYVCMVWSRTHARIPSRPPVMAAYGSHAHAQPVTHADADGDDTEAHKTGDTNTHATHVLKQIYVHVDVQLCIRCVKMHLLMPCVCACVLLVLLLSSPLPIHVFLSLAPLFPLLHPHTRMLHTIRSTYREILTIQLGTHTTQKQHMRHTPTKHHTIGKNKCTDSRDDAHP